MLAHTHTHTQINNYSNTHEHMAKILAFTPFLVVNSVTLRKIWHHDDRLRIFFFHKMYLWVFSEKEIRKKIHFMLLGGTQRSSSFKWNNKYVALTLNLCIKPEKIQLSWQKWFTQQLDNGGRGSWWEENRSWTGEQTDCRNKASGGLKWKELWNGMERRKSWRTLCCWEIYFGSRTPVFHI